MQLTKNATFLDELFLQTQAHLGYFFEHLDLASVQQVVDHLLSCEQTVILTGVGKSGIIAKKIAMTMNSCGSKKSALRSNSRVWGRTSISSNGLLDRLSQNRVPLEITWSFVSSPP